MIGNGQHGFLKRKFCLTNMVAFYEVTVSLDEGRRVDVVHIDFSKASGTSKALKKTFIDELIKYGLDRGQSDGLETISSGSRVCGQQHISSCRPVSDGVHQGSRNF